MLAMSAAPQDDLIADYGLLAEAAESCAVSLAESADLFSKHADLRTMVPALRLLGRAKQLITAAEDELSRVIALQMSKKNMLVAGIPLERTKIGDSVKWDINRLLPVLLARARDERNIDRETGEALETDGDAFLRLVKDCLGIGYAKVGKKEEGTGLLGHGIDPDDFKDRPVGQYRAKVTNLKGTT